MFLFGPTPKITQYPTCYVAGHGLGLGRPATLAGPSTEEHAGGEADAGGPRGMRGADGGPADLHEVCGGLAGPSGP